MLFRCHVVIRQMDMDVLCTEKRSKHHRRKYSGFHDFQKSHEREKDKDALKRLSEMWSPIEMKGNR